MTVYDLAMSLEEDDRYRKLEREYDEATQALATELAGARTEANRLEAENERLLNIIRGAYRLMLEAEWEAAEATLGNGLVRPSDDFQQTEETR